MRFSVFLEPLIKLRESCYFTGMPILSGHKCFRSLCQSQTMGQLCKTRGGWDEALGQAAAPELRLQVSSYKPPGTGH